MTTARRVRGSGFARRLLAVFVVCTLLPLAVSDGLATFALAELAEALEARQQVRTTRQVALQVYDRLLAARATLLVLPAGPDAVGAGPSPQPLGAAQMFRALVRPQGADDPCQAAEPLLVAWCAATDGRTPRPEGEHAAGAMAATSLRTLVGADGAVRLLVARGDPARPAWLAELDPAHVFAPLAESGSTLGHAWRVTDAGGRVLAALGNASDAHEGASSGGGTAHLHATSLFLDSDFAAADWTFESWRGPAELDRHGVPLGAWLALVAAAAALASLFLGTRFLRRLLGPLRSLTDGTRALAAGDPTARVVPAGDDEIAALGHAFNDMADRIDGQIRSLELLAAIDRDVLVGTSLETVVRRVIDGVVALHALPAVGVVWRLGIRHAGWCSVVREAAGATVTGRPPCPLDVLDAAAEPAGSAPAAADAALPAGDREAAGDADVARAVAASGFGNGATVVALRVGHAGRTSGWLVATDSGDDTVRRLLRELCDRLAVAFSARERDAEMAWRATHDGLTGLPNRTGLAARIDALVAAAPEQPFAVLFVDLDRFKDANDSFGHEAGDQLLTEAAARLQEAARRFGDAALVARHGGDEFVIVLPDAGSAERLAMEVVSCLAEPFVLGAEQHAFGGSAGVVVFPVHGRSCDELLRRADTAMYAAKAEGRGRFRVFDADLETAAHLRLAMPAALRRALDGGELVAWFQPRVRADDGGPVGAEALVRWAHPQRGLIHPDDFIGIAEESSLIEDIGRFMLDAACAELVASHGPERGLGRISVNVSARQLASGRLVDDVSSALARHGLSHGTLELEITESALVEDRGQAREQLAVLRRLGTRVALDDFGSGYSSLSMLRDLPIDVLKIDRAFVVDIATDPGSLAVARAIAALARAFGLTLVAEGVETDAQAVILASLGCDELQGYRYARALPAEAFRAWLAARSPSEPVEAL